MYVQLNSKLLKHDQDTCTVPEIFTSVLTECHQVIVTVTLILRYMYSTCMI